MEGLDKVRGRALYVGDYDAARLGYRIDVAFLITSSQATGSILKIESEDVLASPGVRAVITHENAPRLHKVFTISGTEIADILPLQEPALHYAGQCIAMVVADTLEHARTAALLVKVQYSEPSPAQAFTLEQGRPRATDAKTVGAVTKDTLRSVTRRKSTDLRRTRSISHSKLLLITTMRWSLPVLSRPGTKTAA